MDLDHPKERIEWIVDTYYGGKIKNLAAAIDVAPSSFTRIMNDGTFPAWKTTALILRKHPEINPHWFLLGEGPQLVNKDDQWSSIGNDY